MKLKTFFLCHWRKLFLLLLLPYTVSHFIQMGIIDSALYMKREDRALFGQVFEEIEPLKKLLVDGTPFHLTNPRQYGPVVFFVFHPFIKATQDPWILEMIALLICILVAPLGLILTCNALRRHDTHNGFYFLGHVILWLNFSAFYTILYVKNVEHWELFLIALALFGLIRGKNRVAGLAVATATLIKLIPGFLLVFLYFRHRRAFLWALVFFMTITAIAHVLYGGDMGLFYFPKSIRSAAGSGSWAASHFENNALKGMVYKLVSGFKWESPHPYVFVLSESQKKVAFFLSFLGQSVLVFLVCRKFKSGRESGLNKETVLAGFGLAIAAMMLISPQSAMEYSLLTLVAFSIAAHLLFVVKKFASRLNIFLFFLSYLLLGHFIPFREFMQFPLFQWVKDWMGLTPFQVGEAYKAAGFPFWGYMFLFVLFMRFFPKKDPMTKQIIGEPLPRQ